MGSSFSRHSPRFSARTTSLPPKNPLSSSPVITASEIAPDSSSVEQLSSSDVASHKQVKRSAEFLSAPGRNSGEDGSPNKRSLASRRASNASSEFKSRDNSPAPPPSLQPPKLNLTGFSVPVFLPPSPMSAGTSFVDNLLALYNHLDRNNVPRWLQQLLDQGADVGAVLNAAYREIDSVELSRIREGSRIPGHPYSLVAAQQPENMSRNRYYDIIPYDRSRVVLSTPSPPENSDYINASFLEGLAGAKEYIFTQGPLMRTFGDFWQMVWEQKTLVIVMLTKEEERGRIKCHKYWPSSVGEEITLDNIGGIRVKLVDEQTMSNGEVTLRQIKVVKGDETRRVWHLHFIAWPDHRASSPQSVLAVLDLARELQSQAKTASGAGPMVVHCSAGCGRTGTFCTIDVVLSLLEQGGARNPDLIGETDLVRATVEKFREQRLSAVQTAEQYAFCYEAVLYRILEWQHGLGKKPSWVVTSSASATAETSANVTCITAQ